MSDLSPITVSDPEVTSVETWEAFKKDKCWGDLCIILRARIESHRDSLEIGCDNMDEIRALQMSIEEDRLLLALPDAIIDEIKAPKSLNLGEEE